jgi:hypothetical protein
MTSEAFVLPRAFCPVCFYVFDRASNLEDEDAPKAGDFTLCINCSALLKFEPDMQLALSKLEELPIQFRSKFARVAMLIREVQKNYEAGKSGA